MTEGLFLLTTLFVAYVVYVILNEKKAAGKANPVTKPAPASPVQHSEPQTSTVVEKAKAPAAKTKAPASKKAPAAKPVAAKKPAAKSAAAKPAPVEVLPDTIQGTGLKDPTTGEVAKTYTNYRFTKRWIKDALVAEKLLDKVYKNDEINPDIEAKIKTAIIKLETMKKYKP